MGEKAKKQASVRVSPISGVAPPKERQFGQPNGNPKARERMIAYNSQDCGKWWQDEEKKKKRAERLSLSWKKREAFEKKCLYCGKVFTARHKSASYCSKECRCINYFKNGVKTCQRRTTM